MRGRNQIQRVGLLNLATQLGVLYNGFDKISLEHIYKQYNDDAESHSKYGLTCPLHRVIEDEYITGIMVSTITFHLQNI